MCSVFWLFWLSYQYLPSDWLERLLWEPNHGEGIISVKPRLKSVYDFLGLVYCFVYDVFVFSPAVHDIFHTLWHDIAYLCWKCLWNTNQLITLDRKLFMATQCWAHIKDSHRHIKNCQANFITLADHCGRACKCSTAYRTSHCVCLEARTVRCRRFAC